MPILGVACEKVVTAQMEAYMPRIWQGCLRSVCIVAQESSAQMSLALLEHDLYNFGMTFDIRMSVGLTVYIALVSAIQALCTQSGFY